MTNTKQEIAAILNEPMDRKAFLKHVGIGIVAISGVGAALRSLSQKKAPVTVTAKSSYGGSAFGGYPSRNTE